MNDRVVLRAPDPGDLGWTIERHGALYWDEYRWNGEFEALVARIVAGFATSHDAAREAAWIATLGGERAGCVFCMKSDEDDTAKLRCLLVEPFARGHGIGGRLVDRAVAFARDAGYRRIILWTNDVLVDARRIYDRAGFTLQSEVPHHSFGHDLVGQTWSLDLWPLGQSRAEPGAGP